MRTFLFLFFVTQFGFSQLPQTSSERNPECGPLPPPSSAIMEIVRTARYDKNVKLATENYREILLAFVVDSTVYYGFNKDTAAIKESVFREVRAASSIFFEPQFNIRLNVSYIEFSAKDRNYDSKANEWGFFDFFLTDYKNRNDIKRDVMVFWSMGDYGYQGVSNTIGLGSGRLDAIHCRTLTYQPDRFYRTLTHELGHTLGSPHTFDCGWPDGPFEVCTGMEGYCSKIGHAAVKTMWGSVMSYCGGADYFHPLCVDVIKRASYRYLEVVKEMPQRSPGLYYPVKDMHDVHPSGNFSWSPVEKITGYEVVIAQQADFSKMVLDTLVADNSLFTGKSLKFGTVYYWKVRAVNQLGKGQWSEVRMFRSSDEMVLKAPLLNLINRTMTGSDQVLSFKPVSGASEYLIQFYASNSSVVLTEKYRKTTSFVLKEIVAAPGTYKWRVKAVSNGQSGPWSDLQVVTSMVKTEIRPYLSSVPSGSPLFIIDNMNEYGQQASLPGLYRTFELELSENSDFKPLFKKKQTSFDLNGKDVTYLSRASLIADSLEAGKKYFYRMRLKTSLDSAQWLADQLITNHEKRWRIYHHENSVLPFNSILNKVYIDKQNNRWLYGRGGVYKISEDGKSQGKYLSNDKKDMISDYVSVIREDSKNTLWMGTRSGVMSYDNQKWGGFYYSKWTDDPNEGSISELTVSNRDIVYFATWGKKIMQIEGGNLKNITLDSNIPAGFPTSLRTDNAGNLWAITQFYPGLQIKIYDGVKWTENKAIAEKYRNYRSFHIDNKDNICITRGDTLFTFNEANEKPEAIPLQYADLIDDQTGKKSRVYLSSLAPVSKYVTPDRLFFQAQLNGEHVVLETDKQTWWVRRYLPVKNPEITFPVYDLKGKTVIVQGGNILEEYDRQNIIANFDRKSVMTGCKINFRVGIASPPSGNAEGNNLKVFLSDSSSSFFRQVSASYREGEITIAIPAGLKGKGYRFKYTMGDNWLESKESEPFDILDALTVGGALSFCTGDSTTLSVATTVIPSAMYQWMYNQEKTGENLPVLKVGKAGMYQLKVTDANGCQVISSPVIVTERSKVQAGILGNTYFCFGDSTSISAFLYAGNVPYSYEWTVDGRKVNETSDKLTIKQAGRYRVLITDAGGCKATATMEVTERKLLAKITPEAPATVFKPFTVTLSTPRVDSLVYQWYSGSVKIAGATQSTYEIKESGVYSVQVRGGGCSVTSNAVKVSVETPLENEPSSPQNGLEMTIAPNPTQRTIEVSVTSSKMSLLNVQLTDFNGRVLVNNILDKGLGSGRLKIDLSEYPSGVYFVKAQNEDGKVVRKVVKE